MWEYLTIEHESPAPALLNLLGAAGWEVSQTVSVDDRFGTSYQTTFKRRRPSGLWAWLRALASRRAA